MIIMGVRGSSRPLAAAKHSAAAAEFLPCPPVLPRHIGVNDNVHVARYDDITHSMRCPACVGFVGSRLNLAERPSQLAACIALVIVSRNFPRSIFADNQSQCFLSPHRGQRVGLETVLLLFVVPITAGQA